MGNYFATDDRSGFNSSIVTRSLLCLVVPVICLLAVILSALHADEEEWATYRSDGTIQRLTFSNSNRVGYPAISRDGEVVVYREEAWDTSSVVNEISVKRMIKIIRTDGSGSAILFADSTIQAPEPYGDRFFIVGTKPPRISDDGRTVIFAVSLSGSEEMRDHFLGVIGSDGSGFQAISMQNASLAGVEWKKMGFDRDTWKRIATYDINHDGSMIVSAVKGHFGFITLGNPSGLVVMMGDGTDQKALLAPAFENGAWVWDGYPQRPLTGGGWAFALSSDGKSLLFGAGSSQEKTDYDLYLMNTAGTNIRQVTSIHDRLFSFADLSESGDRITFFYAGTKGEGPGTYMVNQDGSELKRLTSKHVTRLDYDDVTMTGEMILYSAPCGGMGLDLEHSREVLLFHPGTEGYVRSGHDMDFPSYPSFWSPDLVSRDGNRCVLAGIPVGKDTEELYLLTVGDMKKTILYCPQCRKMMDPSWIFCPHDGSKLD